LADEKLRVLDPLPEIVEYNMRKRMAKLGFTSPLDELDQDSFEILLLIDSEIDSASREKNRAKGG
jgi:hypothetical protein